MALLTLAMIATAFTVIDAPAASAAVVTNVPGVIQAEDYEDFLDTDPGNRGQASTFNDDVDVWPMIGGGYILGRVLDGEYTTYDINVAETGTYDFAIRNASGAALGGTATISIDDTPIAPPTSLGNSNGWWRFQTTSLGTAPLTEGSHELRIDWGAGQSNFDYLEVTRAEGFTGVAANPVVVPFPGSIPAESYSAYRDTTAGNSGTERDEFTDDVDVWATHLGNVYTGEYTEYDIDVTAAGVFDFSIVHAAGGPGGTPTVSIDGIPIAAPRQLGTTGGWWTFAGIDIGSRVLSAGRHTVRVEWGAGQSNFARIDVRQQSGGSGETPNAPRTAVPGIVEAQDYDRFADLDAGNAGRASAFTDDVDVWPIGGGDYILGRVLEGEYTTYDISVAEDGAYAFEMRHASGAALGGTATISVDGTRIAPATELGNTNGWWRFATTSLGIATLSAGNHTLRVDWGPGQSNVDHINVVTTTTLEAEVVPTGLVGQNQRADVVVHADDEPIASAKVQVNFDANELQIVGCDVDGLETGVCNLVDPGVLELAGYDTAGMTGRTVVATIDYQLNGGAAANAGGFVGNGGAGGAVAHARGFVGSALVSGSAAIARLQAAGFSARTSQIANLDGVRLDLPTPGGGVGLSGDVNCDGEVTIVDAYRIARFAVGLVSASYVCPLPGGIQQIYASAADLNDSGDVNILDAVAVARCSVGLDEDRCNNELPGSGPVQSEAPVPTGPAGALPASPNVTLSVEPGFDRYEWTILAVDPALPPLDCGNAQEAGPASVVELDWPSGGTGEHYLWCVRGRRAGTWSPWISTQLQRSLETRSAQFGSSPLFEIVAGVNVASGNWTFERTDVAVGSVAPGLAITRTYNSQDTDTSGARPFGPGWTAAFDQQLRGTKLASRYVTSQADPTNGSSVAIIRVELINSSGEATASWIVEETRESRGGNIGAITFSKILSGSDAKTLEPPQNSSTEWVVKGRDGSQATFARGSMRDRLAGLVSLTDELGRTLRIDRSGNETTALRDEVSGRKITLNWGSEAGERRVQTISIPSATTNGASATWTYNYNSSGQLDQVCDPEQACENYTWQGSAIKGILRPGETGAFTEEATYVGGRVTSMTTRPEADETNVTLFDYPGGLLFSPNAVTVVTDPGENLWRYTFDTRGNVLTKDAPDIEVDVDGVAVTYPGITTYTYDSEGHRTSARTPRAAAAAGETNLSQFEYNDDGNLIWELDGRGELTSFYYDTDNRLVASCQHLAGPDNPTSEHCVTHTWIGETRRLDTRTTTIEPGVTAIETWTYTDEALIDTYTDGAGRVTRHEYYGADEVGGAPGDRKKTTYPSGLVHEFTYNDRGLVSITNETEIEAGAQKYRLETRNYDERGLATLTQGPLLGNAVTGDLQQLVVETSYNPDRTVEETLTYDARDRAATERKWTYGYDRLGRETSSTSPSVAVGPLGAEVTARLTTSRTFDERGNVEQVCDANLVCTDTTYTERNLPETVTRAGTPQSTMLYWDNGMVRQVTDAEGRIRRFSYDAADRLTRELERDDDPADPWRVANEISYVAGTDWPSVVGRGGLASEGPLASTTLTTYGPTGLPLTISESADVARRTTLTYYGDGQVAAATLSGRGGSERTSYGYDDGGNVDQVTIDNGSDDGSLALQTTMTFDGRGNLLSRTDARGNTTDIRVDRLGRTTRVTLPSVNTYDSSPHTRTATPTRASILTGYDVFGNVTEQVDAQDNRTTSAYDALDRLKTVTHPTIAIDGTDSIEGFNYDANGNLVSKTSLAGHTVVYEFDDFNRVKKEIRRPDLVDPVDKETTEFDYDNVGNIVRTSGPTGAVSETTWNLWNLPTSETQQQRFPDEWGPQLQVPLTKTTVSTYDDLGHLDTVTTPEDLVTDYDHDALGRLVKVTEPGGRETTTTLDYGDRPLVIERPGGFETTYDYDAAGRLDFMTERGPDGTILDSVDYVVDANGNVRSETTAAGVTTSYEWNGRNELEVARVGTSVTNTYGYDRRGNLTYFKDGRANETTYTFNAWNLPDTTREPAINGSHADFTVGYDEAGRAVRSTEPDGVVVTMDYDVFGRLEREEANDGSFRSTAYDPLGRLVAAASGDGQAATFRWDDLGQLRQYSGTLGMTIFDYDDDSRLVTRRSLRRGGGTDRTDTFLWTDTGELAQHAEVIAGLPLSNNSIYGRLPDGRLDTVTSTGHSRAISYYPDGRLKADEWSRNGAVLNGREYAYAVAGNNIAEERVYQHVDGAMVSSRFSYDYDDADRLTTFNQSVPAAGPTAQPGLTDEAAWTADTTTTYGYDAAGNRDLRKVNGVEETWDYDARNRLSTASTGDSWDWNERGTLAASTERGITSTHTFDGLGQLRSVGQSTGNETAYGYDGLGRLATANDATFLYNGLQRDPWHDGTNAYGRSPTGVLTSVQFAAGQFPHLVGVDRYGDVMLTAAMLGGSSTSNSFDPFGESVASWTSGNDLQVGFQGDWTDPTTGDVNMDVRWYAPNSGTFRSRDTWMGELGTPVTLNRYTYAANNPVRYWDPTGYEPEYAQCGYGDRSCSTGLNGSNSSTSSSSSSSSSNPVTNALDAVLDAVIPNILGVTTFNQGSAGSSGGAASVGDQVSEHIVVHANVAENRSVVDGNPGADLNVGRDGASIVERATSGIGNFEMPDLNRPGQDDWKLIAERRRPSLLDRVIYFLPDGACVSGTYAVIVGYGGTACVYAKQGRDFGFGANVAPHGAFGLGGGVGAGPTWTSGRENHGTGVRPAWSDTPTRCFEVAAVIAAGSACGERPGDDGSSPFRLTDSVELDTWTLTFGPGAGAWTTAGGSWNWQWGVNDPKRCEVMCEDWSRSWILRGDHHQSRPGHPG